MRSLVLGVLCVLCGSNSYASPRDELLRLVPNDAGFVVVVQDLRGHFSRLHSSPFAAKFLQSAAGREVAASTDWKKLAEADRMLTQEVGINWTKLRDDVLGDAVVFVYRPAGDEGLVLLRARDPQAAATMFEQLDASQTKSGQLKSVATRQHAGRSYKHRVRKDEPDEFHYQRGGLVAFGSGEGLLKQVIDADLVPPPGEPVLAKRLRELGVETATAVWWVNPRAFDAAISEKARAAVGPGSAVLHAVATHWQALDGAAAFLDLKADARLGLAFAARPDALPPPTRLFFREAAQPSSLLESFPADALLTVTGRLALPPLLQAGEQFLPDDARAGLRDAARKTLGAAVGPDVMAALPERLGPDWGLCVATPITGSSIPAVTAAVRLADPPGRPPVAPRVLDAVHTLATIAAVSYNAKAPHPAVAASEQQLDVTVRYFVNDAGFPPGLRPAYAWKGGYLVLATSPDVIRKFTPPPADPRPASAESEAPIVKVAIRGWAAYLREHQAGVADFLARDAALPVDEARKRLATALELLELFDGVDVTLRTTPGRATATLRVRAAVPLAE